MNLLRSSPGRLQWIRALPLLLLAPPLAFARDASPPPDTCRIQQVKGLPGSHEFASHFIEAIDADPANPRRVFGLTADLSDRLPPDKQLLYLSKTVDGGRTWTKVTEIDSRYFDADIAEGLRNGLAVAPGGTEFVITTQEGAFQVFPQSVGDDPTIKSIPGPRVPDPRPLLSIPKNPGDPVRANVVLITADRKRMIAGYGYFDLNPQLFSYHKDKHGSWIEDGPLPALPTDLDIFSMQFDHPEQAHPRYLYVGTGDQAFRLDLRTKKWIQISGVGDDSSIHSMTTVGGLHLAACWGVYEPVNASSVARITRARFLLHRWKDEVGPNIRAYGIEVDPVRHNRQVLTAITGAYVTKDGGKSWRRLNDLPEGEYHTAHFNPDGSVLISGFPGTYIANPFSASCAPHLRTREK